MDRRERIRQGVLGHLRKVKKSRRSALFAPVMAALGLSEAEMKDRTSDGAYSKAMSLCGTVINELIKLKILQYENDELVIAPKEQEYNPKEIQEYFFGKYLTVDEQKERKPDSKFNILKSFLGNVLKRTDIQAEISRTDSKDAVFQLVQKEIDRSTNPHIKLLVNIEKHPNTPLGNILRSQMKNYSKYLDKRISKEEYEKELLKSVTNAISEAGGEFFESLAISIIKALYRNKAEIVSEKLTGGAHDNGIDGEIILKDPLGLTERIIVQAKTKQERTATRIGEKLIREFYGVMNAFGADKGVLIANFEADVQALALAKRCKNMVIIAKKDLFGLMKQVQIGLKAEKDTYIIDDKVFAVGE